MALRQISLNNFRNLLPATLDFHAGFNLIYGANASGKTSLLEAVNFICEGRSFKTHLSDQCIAHDSRDFLIVGQFDHYQAGIIRNKQSTIIRIDQQNVHKVSTLARKSPIMLLDSASFNLITGSPKYKRKYLDWFLFHVEPYYHQLWLDYNHALKQKNALLKQKRDLTQLDYWDGLLATLCAKIYAYRKAHAAKISELMADQLSTLIDGLDISLKYKPGWDDIHSSIADEFNKRRDRDIKFGFTSVGIHRDDILLLSNNKPVVQCLSRGQLKKLYFALLLSQLFAFKKKSNTDTIVLIDDIESELDQQSVQQVLNIIQILQCQIFMTSIVDSKQIRKQVEDYRLFHVEHGMIKNVKQSMRTP